MNNAYTLQSSLILYFFSAAGSTRQHGSSIVTRKLLACESADGPASLDRVVVVRETAGLIKSVGGVGLEGMMLVDRVLTPPSDFVLVSWFGLALGIGGPAVKPLEDGFGVVIEAAGMSRGIAVCGPFGWLGESKEFQIAVCGVPCGSSVRIDGMRPSDPTGIPCCLSTFRR